MYGDRQMTKWVTEGRRKERGRGRRTRYCLSERVGGGLQLPGCDRGAGDGEDPAACPPESGLRG